MLGFILFILHAKKKKGKKRKGGGKMGGGGVLEMGLPWRLKKMVISGRLEQPKD